jgi:hypothetical protein
VARPVLNAPIWGFSCRPRWAYAQNVAWAKVMDSQPPHRTPCKLHFSKQLFFIDIFSCPLFQQTTHRLDFRGKGRSPQALSTKLSTEILGKCHKRFQINGLALSSPR